MWVDATYAHQENNNLLDKNWYSKWNGIIPTFHFIWIESNMIWAKHSKHENSPFCLLEETTIRPKDLNCGKKSCHPTKLVSVHDRTLYPFHDQRWSPKAYCHQSGSSFCQWEFLSRPACHSHGVGKTKPHYTEGVYNIPQSTNFIRWWWEVTLIQQTLINWVSQIRSITTWHYLYMNLQQPGQ